MGDAGTGGSGSARAAGARAPIIAREGWPIILSIAGGGALVSALAWWLSMTAGIAAAAAGGLVVLWALWFFRDPERPTPAQPGLIISPADGVVVAIAQVAPPAELGIEPAVASAMTRYSIFMNIFNVHVNRSPESGTITKIAYRPGKFFNASLDKASEHNERCAYRLDLADGTPTAFVQIAGLVARRIVTKVNEGQRVGRGERIGLIRFGSRVDVYLPRHMTPRVAVGDKAAAGVTVLAALR
ncbi:MAG TPA: phosphatidylserine decarboxylase family protein [Phycisphaerales bacterium]|nr:phosphatidylserine decarboxylase family protein [Phycisphaerales bacterium]